MFEISAGIEIRSNNQLFLPVEFNQARILQTQAPDYLGFRIGIEGDPSSRFQSTYQNIRNNWMHHKDSDLYHGDSVFQLITERYFQDEYNEDLRELSLSWDTGKSITFENAMKMYVEGCGKSWTPYLTIHIGRNYAVKEGTSGFSDLFIKGLTQELSR